MSESDKQLPLASIEAHQERASIDGISAAELRASLEGELGASDFLPDGVVQVDPRSHDRIIYSSARAKRPHDNKPASEGSDEAALLSRPCVICAGKITGVLDVATLSEGATFINKNLFPVLFPRLRLTPTHRLPPTQVDVGAHGGDKAAVGAPAYGMHFLQWTSSLHDRDWHNMSRADRLVACERLAVLEGALLESGDTAMPDNSQVFGDRPGRRGYVGIIKNYGALVGGSLIHGHQQIAYSSAMPRRLRDDWRFEQERGERYADFILRENPTALTVHEYGDHARLLVPYYMRRPYDLQLVFRRTEARYLSELAAEELAVLAEALHDGIALMRSVLPRLGRSLAYNIIVHNGPGAGLYVDFLPYTQEQGGYEHLGLILCQADPLEVAQHARSMVKDVRA